MSDDPLDGIEIPDDLSGLTQEEPPTVAVVVTQVAVPEALAAACSLAKVEVDAVPSPVGALAVLRDPSAGEETAGAVSRLLRQVPVVLLVRREGRITATQWVAGAKEKKLPAGLVLSGAPEVLEELLLGDLPASQVEGCVTSVGISRWKAMRMLSSYRR